MNAAHAGPGRDEVRWERLFPDELEARFHACPAVWFAYGLCEPHGPHCALGLDALKAHGICCHAARAHGGIVAPPDYWHIHEIGLYASWGQHRVGPDDRTWLTAVPPWIHFKQVCYQLRAADALGFQAAVLVTGHYGPNWQDLKRLCELLQPRLGMQLHALPDFEVNQPGFRGEGDGGDHAGRVESSLLWALEPDCVDPSRLPPQGAQGHHFAMGDNAHQADRREGERMVADQVAALGAIQRELLAAYRRSPPADRRPLGFAEIETIWQETVLPELPSFASMGFMDRPAPPPDTPWALNHACHHAAR